MKLVSVIEYRRCHLYKTRDALGLSKRRVEEERPLFDTRVTILDRKLSVNIRARMENSLFRDRILFSKIAKGTFPFLFFDVFDFFFFYFLFFLSMRY